MVVLPRLSVPGSILLSNVPAGLVGKPVMSPREDWPPLVPNDLLVGEEANLQQAIKYLASELRRVPHVPHLETRNQSDCLRPVGARDTGNRRFLMALGPAFQIAGLSRPVFVEPRPIPPLRIQFNSIRRVAPQQQR